MPARKEYMNNHLWVVEYNAFPKKAGTSWTAVICNPEWNKAGANREAKHRAYQTCKPRKNYRVTKYISEA